MDRIVDSIIGRVGKLEVAYLTGDYADGRDAGIVDLVLVGAIDWRNLADLVAKTERYTGRKIRPMIVSATEFERVADCDALKPRLELWRAGGRIAYFDRQGRECD